MGWTYNHNPSGSNRDAVRFLVGDTDFNAQMVLDEEITYALAEEGNVHLAASLVAKAIAGKFAVRVDRNIGDLKISFGQRQKHFMDLATSLHAHGVTSGGRVFAGGIRRSEKDTEKSDTDRVDPSFARGMHDNLGSREVDDNNPGFDSI